MANIAKVIREEIAAMVSREWKGAGIAKELKAIDARLSRIEKRISALEAGRVKAVPMSAGRTSAKKVDGRKLRFSSGSLKRLRGHLGVTQGELAKLLGVSGNAVWQWEAGRARPRDKSIRELKELRGIGKREIRRRIESAS